eukprot:TRINITY_DN7105_c0_g1_i4.p1 TRINITY_DN7105_c0_g1~~TRINITY_DN7105_c0_g1_i4.p1  ORF type:complete len:104 (+),score=0.47 TRINITY_DN7105_c0_g1_i4:183-494(+)
MLPLARLHLLFGLAVLLYEQVQNRCTFSRVVVFVHCNDDTSKTMMAPRSAPTKNTSCEASLCLHLCGGAGMMRTGCADCLCDLCVHRKQGQQVYFIRIFPQKS